MNDTETRLRDYLQTKAATVPGNAEPPGLETSAKRHLWPVLLTAAAIGAVLVLTVPFLTRLGDPTADPAKPAPGLTVPYYLTDPDKEQSTLHDGARTVAMPSNVSRLEGRVAGGWAASLAAERPGGGRMQQPGMLKQDGKVRSFGPKDSRYLTLSPDRRQLATAEPLGGGKTRVATYDVASGRQLKSVTLPHLTTVIYGWNKDGVWLAEDYKVGSQPMVWQPSTGRLTPLSIPGFDLRLVARPDSDRVLVQVRPQAERWCMQAARLVGGKLVVDREYCGQGGRMVYPTISADGGTLLLGEQRLAVDVATGRQTTLRAPVAIDDLNGPVFEDSTHVLAVLRNSSATPTRAPTPVGRNRLLGELKDRSVYRCDVTNGSCERAMAVPDGQLLTLVQP
ncbi:hypothetical protein [Kribbella sp. NPDC051770]|uniref:hypothetical protein n=1 Tax=Kribbella sp. NPDC051770 TaxID=3155413 RepID=UPI00341660A7